MMRPLERGKFRVRNRSGSALGGVSNLIVKFEFSFWRSAESMGKKSPLEAAIFLVVILRSWVDLSIRAKKGAASR